MFGLIDKSKGYLFSTYDLRQSLENRKTAMRKEVDALEPNRLLNTAPADLANYLVEKYRAEPISLRRNERTMTDEEVQVDVSGDPSRRFSMAATGRILRPGQRIEVFVPFDGEAGLFYCQGNQISSSPPKASVRGSDLVITFTFPIDRAPNILSELERTLGDIEQHLSWSRVLIDPYNNSLAEEAAKTVEARRQQILANQGRVSALGIPVRARNDAPRTYAIPDVRRKAMPTLPPATSTPFEPEPAWSMEHYEHALSVMQSMAALMERSPSTFSKQNEEHLRDQFLFQLNGQFEGRATGETFNLQGKTDILLRENDRNVFIAECKFWKGSKKFSETIDQLLGYTAWRDTKTAILVFNRGTGTTTVLKGIAETAEAHPNYKRTLPYKHESGFRYVFHHTGDTNREFILTVLVFHVPE